MQIQWFPGHMHKARVQMAEILPKVDVVVEILDARIPYSSENPMLAELRRDKPCLKVLNKSDLADTQHTAVWLEYLDRQKKTQARAVSTETPSQVHALRDACVEMFPDKCAAGRQITGMIAGIPNVGKSTLINILARRKVAKTGNEPAVTKAQQRIKVGSNVVLLDTPGVLWPNVANPNSGYRLAAVGSIRDTAMEYEDVAHFLCDFLLRRYPKRLQDRYSIESIPADAIGLMEEIGVRRGCLNKRGVINYERVSRILLNELRSGKLGRVTLETPEMMEEEEASVKLRQREKETQKAKRKADRKARFKTKPRPRPG